MEKGPKNPSVIESKKQGEPLGPILRTPLSYDNAMKRIQTALDKILPLGEQTPSSKDGSTPA